MPQNYLSGQQWLESQMPGEWHGTLLCTRAKLEGDVQAAVQASTKQQSAGGADHSVGGGYLGA